VKILCSDHEKALPGVTTRPSVGVSHVKTLFNGLSARSMNDFVYKERNKAKKLSCRRETARRFVSLNILQSRSRSFEMTLLSRECVRPY